MKLEGLTPETVVRGILPDSLVTVIEAKWFGSDAVQLTYKSAVGELGHEILYRDDEARLAIADQGRPWSFDGDGALFRLVAEAQRIRLAHLFDPVLAVHTSDVEPLPHQITAVYEEMLPRQPLRFLLVDDPGAGKTIMGPAHQGIDRSRRSAALSHRLPGQLGGAVAGRTVPALSPAL